VTGSWFANLSIRVKLLWIILLTSIAALMVVGLAIVTYDSITFKREKYQELSTQADLLGAISTAALVFNDPNTAKEYLSALKASAPVASAILYDGEGNVFATYRRSKNAILDPPPVEAEGHRFKGDDLLLFRSIDQGGEAIGTVYLRTELGFKKRLLQYAGIVFGLLIGSLLVALVLSTRLQGLVSRPLLEVTAVAREVIDHQDYAHRAIKHSDDEVGVLVDAFNQMLAHIQQREAALQAANQALQEEINEHKSAREQVTSLNETLEQRVAERTAELESANLELEAFSYSVSHDLRAPLRAIDGFSILLQEGYQDRIDQEGQNYLQRVRAATQRMGHLIDDLLKLSRTTRSEMRPAEVDLSALAETIANELQELSPDRQVTFSITSDMIAYADPALIRVVLENLLGNAWKFSRNRSEARIEMGTMINNGKTTYFVRDNGTGFDMQYADRLFGAFQRLHSTSEFEGTGIGLANVHRIIRRHGGQVWAEGKLDEGATLYFTLSEWRKPS
jgi:signal transduction histidine kinase